MFGFGYGFFDMPILAAGLAESACALFFFVPLEAINGFRMVAMSMPSMSHLFGQIVGFLVV